MKRFIVLSAVLLGSAVHAGIPVVGGQADLQLRLQHLLSSPELGAHDPQASAAEYAELRRQREADEYNRKKAEDLRRAKAASRLAPPQVPAAGVPSANHPTAR